MYINTINFIQESNRKIITAFVPQAAVRDTLIQIVDIQSEFARKAFEVSEETAELIKNLALSK